MCLRHGTVNGALDAKRLPADIFKVPGANTCASEPDGDGTTLAEAFDVYFLLKHLGDFSAPLAKQVNNGDGWAGCGSQSVRMHAE